MIPYTTEPRRDTGVTNVKMGIWLLIASEVMLMGAFASSYALIRVSAEAWTFTPTSFTNWMGLAATAAMAGIVLLAAKLRRADSRRSTTDLVLTAVLCAAFLGFISADYVHQWSLGLRPSTSMPLALYYVLTGVHSLHVAAGLAAVVWVLAGAPRVPPAVTSGRLHALWLYWLFVAASWLGVVAMVWL